MPNGRNFLILFVCSLICPALSFAAPELMCDTYAEGQQFRSCILTGLDNCSQNFSDCTAEPFVTTRSLVTARAQSICCSVDAGNKRDSCWKRRRKEIKRAKSLPPLFRAEVQNILTDYLTSDTVCSEE